MGFQVNTATKKLLRLTKIIKVVKGGTWAGKTYSINAVLIDRAIKTERNKITIVADSIPSLKQGAVEQFKEIMQTTGRWNDSSWNATERKYTFYNHSTIRFDSYDSVGKAKAAGKRNILFLNEANHLHSNICDALMTRTTDEIWIDYNPDNEFWVDTEVIPREDAESIVLTYLDNEFTPQKVKEDIAYKLELAKTSNYWANWCKVYVFGETGNLEGQVFDDWQIIDMIPAQAKYIGSGLDFGHNPDPTCLVDGYQLGNQIFFREIVYRTELRNSELAEIIKSKQRTVFADHDSNIINELRLKGCNIQKAVKGNVVSGIKQLKDYECYITSDSLNAIKEKKYYIWATDRNNQRTGEPIDAWNHFFDPCRYLINSYLRLDKSLKPQLPLNTTQSKFLRGEDTGLDAVPW